MERLRTEEVREAYKRRLREIFSQGCPTPLDSYQDAVMESPVAIEGASERGVLVSEPQ